MAFEDYIEVTLVPNTHGDATTHLMLWANTFVGEPGKTLCGRKAETFYPSVDYGLMCQTCVEIENAASKPRVPSVAEWLRSAE